jgi:hypothetical protein
VSESKQRSAIAEAEQARSASRLHADICKHIYLSEIEKSFEQEGLKPSDYPRMLEVCSVFAVQAADRLLWQMSQPRQILGTKPPQTDNAD